MSPKILKQNLFIALLLCAFSSLQATTYEYWFAAPDLSSDLGDSPVEVIITTTSKAANVELSIPANPSFTPITRNLSAWDHESISLSAYLSLIEPTAGAVESKGILIESSSPINVQYAVLHPNNMVYYTVKGSAAFGKKFVFPGQTKWSRDNSLSTTPTNSMDIVGVLDGAEVKVYLTTDANSSSAGDTLSFTLNRGETYSIQNNNTLSSKNLIGSTIESTKLIAVTYTEDAVKKSGYSDAMGDQLIPINKCGTSYVGSLGFLTDGATIKEYLVVHALEDGQTNITVNGGPGNHTFNGKGEVRTFDLVGTSSFSISSNKDILVYQISGSGNQTSMSILPPISECSGSQEVCIQRPSAKDFYIMIFVPNGGQNKFSSNVSPNPFKNANFSALSGMSWKFGVIKLSASNIPVGGALELTNSSKVFYAYVLSGDSSTGSYFGTSSPFHLEGFSLLDMFHY